MKIVLSESQYKRLIETEQEQKVLEIPNLRIFGKNREVAWIRLQEFLEKRGNPPYSIGGDLDLLRTRIESLGNLTSVGVDLDLKYTPIESLGNLTSVGGYLDLRETQIKSLGNLQSVGVDLDLLRTPIESLGNLTSVGGNLDLEKTPIESLGNLKSVGNTLYLMRTPLSKKYTEEEIRQMVDVGGKIYL